MVYTCTKFQLLVTFITRMPNLCSQRINMRICYLLLFHFLFILMVDCTPPEDPIKCSSEMRNCIITNSYGMFPDRSICRAANAAYPTSEDEIIQAVAFATKNRKKMKVTTRYSHSIPKLVCPDDDDGLIISTKYLNRTLRIDQSAMMMTMESGVTLRQLINEAAKAGLALPYAPYFWGVTLGGMLGTGAHGSSLWGKGSSVHDYVVGLRIITPAGPEDGFAKVRVLDHGQADLEAAKVSLGVLGVISQVTLKLQPLFKRSITYLIRNDSDLADQAASYGNQHEFADITWYPSQRRAVYRKDDRVSANTLGDGVNDFTGFQSTLTIELAANRVLEESQEASKNGDGKCSSSRLITSLLSATAYGLKNNGIAFIGYPLVGYQNHLQSSGSCLDSLEDALITACPWDPRVKGQFFHQTTLTIGESNVKCFIQDVQKLVHLEPNSLCGVELYNGILMRYVKASSAYLGKQEDGIDFDITYYRSKDPMKPRLYEDILEEIEQIGVFKYGGLPHWGKNRNIAFDGVMRKYRNAEQFLKVKKVYDPDALFSSEWTDQILGLKDGLEIVKDGCALEGLCICSQDSHCAPNEGYFCRPGKVYQDARVCTRLNSK